MPFRELKAQAPGGVFYNLQIWLKADAGVEEADSDPAENGDSVLNWVNQISGGESYSQPTLDDQANLVENSINFNPALHFDGHDVYRVSTSVNYTEATYYFIFNALDNNGGDVSLLQSSTSGRRMYITAWWGNDNIAYINGNAGTMVFGPATPFEQSALVRFQKEAGNANLALEALANGISNEVIGVMGNINHSLPTDYLGGRNQWTGTGIDADLSEMLVYDRALDPSEQHAIESYLALKYGISLDQTTPTDYILSDGTVAWDTSVVGTTYTHDITGIVRDNAAVLSQIKSKSQNTDALITIEAENEGTNTTPSFVDIANLESMMWSNNNDNILDWSDTEIPIGGYIRLSREWIIEENNGDIGDVVLSVSESDLPTIPTTLYLLTDSDGDFSTGTTITAMNNTAGVWSVQLNLSDGEHFTFATDVPIAPGGVWNSIQLWLKADAGVTTSGTSVTNWGDQSSNVVDALQGTVLNQPNIIENDLNFNPAITFDGIDDYMSISGGILGTDTYEDICVYTVRKTNQVKSSFAFNESTTPRRFSIHLPWSDNILYWDAGNTNGAYRLSAPWGGVINIPYLWSLGYSTGGVTSDGNHQDISRNGQSLASDTDASSFSGKGSAFYLGSENSTSNFDSANLAELIFYKAVTPADHNKIESYLALKYGISLDQTTPTNYTLSDGTVAWDASIVGTTYIHDITGIARDDDAALSQVKSKSQNTDALITIEAENEGTNTTPAFVDIANLESMMWSNNNDNILDWSDTEIPTRDYVRLSREWLIEENNGDIGDVVLSVSESDLPTIPTTLYLLTDSDGDFSTGATITAMSNTAGVWSVQLNLSDGEYFAFARDTPIAPGGVFSNLQIWLKADAGVEEANADPAENGDSVLNWLNQISGGESYSQPTLDDQANLVENSINFNPALHFDGHDVYQISTSVNYTEATYYFIFNALDNNGGDVSLLQFSDTEKRMCIIGYWGNDNISYVNANGGTIVFGPPTPFGQSALVRFQKEAGNANLALETLVNGVSNEVVGAMGNINHSLPTDFLGGRNQFSSEKGIDADFAEMLVFDRSLDSNEQHAVESYLALKYGISLDQTIPTDYILSDGTVAWDAMANAVYKYNIMGIGRDDISKLNQRISQSANYMDSPILSTTQNFTLSNTDASRVSLNNNEFLIMGHDNAPNSFTESFDGRANTRLARIWKVDKTGTVGDIYIAIPKSSYTFPASDTPIVTISDDTTFDKNDTIVVLTDDGTHYWAAINPTDGQYLTFATSLPFFIVSETALTVLENNGTGVFTVKLGVPSTSNVVFNLSSDNTGEATVTPSTLTFTPTDWNSDQSVTVTGVNDMINANHSAIITISVDDLASDDSFDPLADQTITITLTNDDVDFTINPIANTSINENVAYTGSTPTLAGDTPIGTATYTLSGIDADDFTIHPTSGVVSMIAKDFENPTDDNTDNIYQLTITATDSNSNSDSEDWSVTVDDVIEVANFTINPIANTSINENMAYAGPIPTLAGDTPVGIITYTLSGIDADDFTIHPTFGVVSMIAKDFENPTDDNTDNIYQISITATDSNSNSDSEDWSVTINDLNEEITIAFNITPIADANINENVGYTGPIPTLTGDTPIGRVTYTLSGIDADDFTIHPTSGVVSMIAKDFENPMDDNTDNIYQLTITATDSNSNSDSEDWSVIVKNVVENSTNTIAIANAFTPNNDGINDNWIIKGIENYPNSNVKVFNRWGHKVFESYGYQNNWAADYKSSSKKLPSGSYYYIIDLKNNSSPMDGWLFINY